MRMRSATALAVATVLAAGMVSAQEQDRGQDQEGPRLSPALEQLRETVSDRLHAAADKLGLTAEQRDKIREIHTGFAPKYQAQREARRELRRDEFKELGAILTPEQREQVKDAVEERIETVKEGAPRRRWPEVVALHNSMADRLEAAADELHLSDEQRTKIRESFRPFAQKYREQRAEHRTLVEDELKAIGEVLTPEQRQLVRRHVEGRIVRAAAAETVADRLRAAADKLDLTSEQHEKIREAGRPFAEKFREQRRERRALLGEEMRALAKVLTPEQREKVRDWREDRVVVVGVEIDPANPPALAQLRETLADRLHAAADELGLTTEQRDKIREIRADFAARYKAQRAARRELRQDELKAFGAILTPEQRDKAKAFVEEREESGQDR
jgi:Spy/CpxP family protein refolding chaperone